MRGAFVAVLVGFVLPALSCAHARPARVMAGWEHRHPVASAELGTWVRTHPAAARALFEWDAHHPLGAQNLVTWAIRHPLQPVDRFVARHLGRPRFGAILENHRPASQAFLAWCRRHPDAAEDLVAHPSGLWWAGNHLYASAWTMERR